MTKQLAQYSVPAENSRVIRVFLSSTFRDMEMERSALVKLFKGLQVKAASRGATISLVDLRWGITEEDAKSGKVVEICLKEIVNSRPFFIGMVGDRYGWCPSYEDLSQTLNDSLEYRWIEDDLNHHLSVTEIEMQFGVLRNPNPLHAYFYIKQSADDELSCSEEESLKLKRLKESILQQERYPVQEYDCCHQHNRRIAKPHQEIHKSNQGTRAKNRSHKINRAIDPSQRHQNGIDRSTRGKQCKK